jgi:hypothetical protein
MSKQERFCILAEIENVLEIEIEIEIEIEQYCDKCRSGHLQHGQNHHGN